MYSLIAIPAFLAFSAQSATFTILELKSEQLYKQERVFRSVAASYSFLLACLLLSTLLLILWIHPNTSIILSTQTVINTGQSSPCALYSCGTLHLNQIPSISSGWEHIWLAQCLLVCLMCETAILDKFSRHCPEFIFGSRHKAMSMTCLTEPALVLSVWCDLARCDPVTVMKWAQRHLSAAACLD